MTVFIKLTPEAAQKWQKTRRHEEIGQTLAPFKGELRALKSDYSPDNRLSCLFYVEWAERPVRMETVRACLAALRNLEDVELAYHQDPVAVSATTVPPRPA